MLIPAQSYYQAKCYHRDERVEVGGKGLTEMPVYHQILTFPGVHRMWANLMAAWKNLKYRVECNRIYPTHHRW